MVNIMASAGGNYTEVRPWGKFENLLDTEYTKVKRIWVNPNASLSLQYHHSRSEVWTVVSGSGKVRIGDHVMDVKAGDVKRIALGAVHRATGGPEGMIFIEVQLSPEGIFDEDDIVRIEDIYGR